MTTTPPTPTSNNRWLGVSALALVAAILFLATRTPTPAMADLVAANGSTVALTVAANNKDVLVVLDSRSEQLLTYRLEAGNTLELFGKQDLPSLFAEARGRSGTRNPANPTKTR